MTFFQGRARGELFKVTNCARHIMIQTSEQSPRGFQRAACWLSQDVPGEGGPGRPPRGRGQGRRVDAPPRSRPCCAGARGASVPGRGSGQGPGGLRGAVPGSSPAAGMLRVPGNPLTLSLGVLRRTVGKTTSLSQNSCKDHSREDAVLVWAGGSAVL